MSLSIGAGDVTSFQHRLDDFAKFSHFQISASLPTKQKLRVFTSATQFDLVVVGIHGMSRQTKRSFGITADMVSFCAICPILRVLLYACLAVRMPCAF